MLLLAIWKRIQQYAVTEPRYFLVILSLWLAGISLFYAFSRSRNIKVIPATLAILAVVTFAGPWSAYAVSRRSQTARLENLLERNGMLVEGGVRTPPSEVSFDDRREISAVLRYLAENHGTASIESWFPEGRLAEVDTIAGGSEPTERRHADERAALITAELGLDYVGSWTPGEGGGFNFSVDWDGPPLRISGYDFVVRDRSTLGDTVRVEGLPVAFAYDEEVLAVVMLRDGEEVLSLSLTQLIERALDYARSRPPNTRIPAELLTVEGEIEDLRIAVSVTSIHGVVDGPADPVDGEASAFRVTRLHADYFFSAGP
jgi:hypothetical protein